MNFFHEQNIKNQYTFVCQIICTGGQSPCAPETVTAHAFTFMLSGNSSSVFAMRNPWGLKSVDGVLEIPNKRSVVKTIDVRAVKPGAAAPYLRQGIQPYTPPVFAVKPTDIGVSERLLIKARTNSKTNELW